MDKTVLVNRKSKPVERAELEQLSKEELINRVIQLNAHNIQLKNILHKNIHGKKKTNFTRNNHYIDYDFSKCQTRHIILRLYYLGWDYQGYATQEDSVATIEYHLFEALVRTCMIECREKSNYHRCGRTDKGVSAFHQVISINIRSKFHPDEQMTEESIKNELDYVQILNKVLPEGIRCLTWMPIANESYSARFDCFERTYRYYFPRGSLNIPAMQLGCEKLVGTHDFRNLCKMDVGNGVIVFDRLIKKASIAVVENKSASDSENAWDMFYFEITGKAFLWHQVRCIMSILILIGQGNEDSGVLDELLDVEKNPCKPQYSLANEVPLILYNCKFNDITVEPTGLPYSESMEIERTTTAGKKDLTEWVYDEKSIADVLTDLQKSWSANQIKTAIIKSMLEDVQRIYDDKFPHANVICNQADNLLQGVQSKQYLNLMKRQKCESLENRIKHYVKKQRIEMVRDIHGNIVDLDDEDDVHDVDGSKENKSS